MSVKQQRPESRARVPFSAVVGVISGLALAVGLAAAFGYIFPDAERGSAKEALRIGFVLAAPLVAIISSRFASAARSVMGASLVVFGLAMQFGGAYPLLLVVVPGVLLLANLDTDELLSPVRFFLWTSAMSAALAAGYLLPATPLGLLGTGMVSATVVAVGRTMRPLGQGQASAARINGEER